MPAPLGEIWLAGAGGDCSQAGGCASGPCGPGEIITCPDAWTNTVSKAFAWASPTAINFGGRLLGVGESLRLPRYIIPEASRAQFQYPVEYFGEATYSPFVSPPTTASFIPTLNDAGVAVPSGRTYDPNLPNLYCNGNSYAYVGTGTFSAFYNGYGLSGDYERWRSPAGGGSGGGSPTEFWRQGNVWYFFDNTWPGTWNGTDTRACYITMKGNEAFWHDGSYAGTIAWSGYTPATGVPEGILAWGIETLFGGGFAPLDLTDWPLVGSPGEFTLPYADSMIFDVIKVLSIPEDVSFNGIAETTLRSNCEVPPP
jgi:hypothetical protein